MSARERSRYMTTAVAFLIAFTALGLLFIRSMKAMAQQFTFRPTVAVSNTYADNIPSTRRLDFALDQNINTAAVTYTNADLDGNGSAQDANFGFSGRWSSFNQTAFFIKNVGLYVVRDASGNNSFGNLRQWKIEYTVNGPNAADSLWNEIAQFTITYTNDTNEGVLDPGEQIINTSKTPAQIAFIVGIDTSTNTLVLERYHPEDFPDTDYWLTSENIQDVGGTFTNTIASIVNDPQANPSKGTVGPVFLDNNIDMRDDLAVRTRSRQFADDPTASAILEIFDIRVEADWNTSTGGLNPLEINTTSLPNGTKGVSYDEFVDASGGNPPYSWTLLSGQLPPGLTPYNSGTDPDYGIHGTPTTPGTFNFTLRVGDSSSPQQTYQQDLSIFISGLAISPQGPDLDPATKSEDYKPPSGQRFDHQPTTPGSYYWCKIGDIPNGMTFLMDGNPSTPVLSCPSGGDPPATSAYQADYLQLGGIPDDDGTYPFTLKLNNSSEVATHNYLFKVLASGVTYLPKKLKDYVKGVTYGTTGATWEMTPEFIVATMIQDNIAQAGYIYVMPPSGAEPAGSPPTGSDPSLPVNVLDLVPGGDLSLPSGTSGAMKINIEGSVHMTQAAGTFTFYAGILDPGNLSGATDSQQYKLTILERKTDLLKTPPSAATSSTGILIDYSGASNEANLKVGDLLTNTSQTPNVTASVVSYAPDADQLLVAHTDETKWASGDAIEGPPGASQFSASISSNPTGTKTAYLQFTVMGAGGAPGQTGNHTNVDPNVHDEVDADNVPYYSYRYLVAPVGTSPAIATPSGKFPPDPPTSTRTFTTAVTDALLFVDSSGRPVTGTYDVTFWAEDVLRRSTTPVLTPHNADNNFMFQPATVRITVNPPTAVEPRPIKLRQEIFR